MLSVRPFPFTPQNPAESSIANRHFRHRPTASEREALFSESYGGLRKESMFRNI
jgi:hypothetical protein